VRRTCRRCRWIDQPLRAHGLYGWGAALDEWGPASQADLGRGTGIDRSDVTAALSELESRRLVERSVDPEHRRRNIVTITPAGVEQLLELDTSSTVSRSKF
jgi:DNA-binding MarR family transcriptional regulator